MRYTPEEIGRLLANRPNQPHYIEWLVRQAITEALKQRIRQRDAEAPAEVFAEVKAATTAK